MASFFYVNVNAGDFTIRTPKTKAMDTFSILQSLGYSPTITPATRDNLPTIKGIVTMSRYLEKCGVVYEVYFRNSIADGIQDIQLKGLECVHIKIHPSTNDERAYSLYFIPSGTTAPEGYWTGNKNEEEGVKE